MGGVHPSLAPTLGRLRVTTGHVPKARTDSPRKIDAAMAAIIAYERASTRRGPDSYVLAFDDAELVGEV